MNASPSVEVLQRDPAWLIEEIRRLKAERGAILLAHYYQDGDIQDLADFVGDSLELARAAQRANSKVIVFCGVRFMAEVASILNPEAEVLIPSLEAGCSLEDSCQPEDFRRWREEHPGAVSVTYINCSAAVKALSDVIVTSSSAEKILRQLPEDRPILFAPDRHLGAYLQRKTGRDLILWPGTCVVHEQFSLEALAGLRLEHPRALVVAHPECPEGLLAQADFVGSTSAILGFVVASPDDEFLIATEPGIIHQMEKKASGKRFIPIPGGSGECACNVCPFMKKNTLTNLWECLRDGRPTLRLPEELRLAALKPLERMLEMASR
ncbi:MAG: quinolinate synthase NadA [Thermoanaerobaculaceae bacterium]|nr:quinolinate synthase NadA [Thermoanaerobaculaceae bacterium]MDI9622289.1 quinolinate synthase NadA [Acidobacteriota bacterium]NLH10102.1 quinolinate synthase NadA [Holophagae bacterium]HPW55044.1 quinolinate synthase NadA [Thermoanaerobaculaceae bacterium]